MKNKKEYALEDFKLNPLSSLDATKKSVAVFDTDDDLLSLNDATTLAAEAGLDEETVETLEENNPIFKELAEPKLPELKRENRARLQMQSPTRIYFYWSVKTNPFQTLNHVFGENTSYQLVAKLINSSQDREDLFPVEAEGEAWFDTDADSAYRAEIGFYAPNRPFIRLMFSNTIETPRRNPSPRRDYAPNFTVSAQEFAEVLDVSGFRQDAFEVALAGDDAEFADKATQTAFSQIVGERAKSDYAANDSSEIRFVLLALASDYTLEDLREYISRNLFAVLQENAERLDAEKALAALQEHFGVLADEIIEEESSAPTVFGASLINFPRLSKRKFTPKFAPLSSLNLRK
ncbi:MAG: DUF4912 domain-containing protein [Pyrinomonadaceae bacterium]